MSEQVLDFSRAIVRHPSSTNGSDAAVFPAGEHICHFFSSKQDLLDVLVPYFAEGLYRGFFCRWEVGGPLTATEAERALALAVGGLRPYLERGQLDIFNAGEIDRDDRFGAANAVQSKEDRSLRGNWPGFRCGGVVMGHGPAHAAFEAESMRRLTSPATTLCSYPLDTLSTDDVLDVIASHRSLLIRRHGAWRLIPFTVGRRVGQALRRGPVEDRFRLLANTIPQIVFICDRAGDVRYFSDQWYTFTGDSKDPASMPSWTASIHPNDLNRILENWRTSLETGATFESEYRLRRRDGSYHWFLGRAVPVRDDEGRVAEWFGTATDIEDQLAVGEAARLGNAIVASSSDAIVTKTLDGTITSWNKSAERIFGYTAEEAIGGKVTMLFPPDHLNEEPEIIRRIKAGELVDHYETVRRRKDGSVFPVSLTISAIRSADGRIIGASKIARDITDQKRYEHKLISQANELEQFAYVASHDLQEPLRKVALYSDMLVSKFGEQAGPEASKYVRLISSAVTRMQRLITDLLAFSRAERDLRRETVDLNETFDKVMSDLEVLIRENGAVIEKSRLPTVSANAFQMHQLLQNLVSNAIKFRGDAPPRVSVSGRREGGSVTVTVQDNGIGIDPRYQQQIFRVFQRLHAADKYAGTGIGLAICKKIVEQHKGVLWVDSAPGQGAAFSFSIPDPDAAKEGHS